MAPVMLVDLDGPIADFEAAVFREMRDRHGIGIPPAERGFYFAVADEYGLFYGESVRQSVLNVIATPRFYSTFPLVRGAVRGLHELQEAGWDVLICTAPSRLNPTCTQDKLEWIEEELGTEWVPRTVVTRDKTFVYGDILWDDKPNVIGRRTPTWNQWLFDAPYNRNVDGLPRASWEQNPWLTLTP